MAYLLSASLCMEFGANMVPIELSFLLSNAQLLLNNKLFSITHNSLFAPMLPGCSICHIGMSKLLVIAVSPPKFY